MRAIKPLITLILFAALIPSVYAITFEGPINFVGSHGGNVRFGSTFTAVQFRWVNGLNRFASLSWGGSNIGSLGFDCDSNVNMTVTDVSTRSLTYTIQASGVKHSYVYYGSFGEPSSYSGASSLSYDSGTGISDLTHTGSVTVTIQFSTISHELNNAASVAASFTLLVILSAVFTYQSGGDIKDGFVYFVIGLAFYLVIVRVITGMGY